MDSRVLCVICGNADLSYRVNEKLVYLAGTFPPPVHGMAAVNAAVRDRLAGAGASVVVIDTAAATLDRGLVSRLRRLPRIARGLARFAFARHVRGSALYFGVSGGFGQVFEIGFVLIARVRRSRIFLHHHSFAYLSTRRRLTGILVRAAGRYATHIALSDGMAERLRSLYGVASSVTVSNAVFFLGSSDSGISEPRGDLCTLGFLGNIAAEKGIFLFLDLVMALQQSGLQLTGRIAGPFQDAATESRLRQRLLELKEVEYVGAKYGVEKADFFDSIDVLVFPTLYVNEAEPLVILEAMQRAVPVIAYGRGCIPERVTPNCGCVIPSETSFVPEALEQIEIWMRFPPMFHKASAGAALHFAALRQASAQRWALLQAQIIGSSP